VLDITGQRVSANDRLYLAALLPSLIIWGDHDPLIPVDHATVAHKGLPGSRLEIFEGAGHFPQLHDPMRFAYTLTEFIETTEPTQLDFTDADFDRLRELLLSGGAKGRRRPNGQGADAQASRRTAKTAGGRR
jgi:hypothetical protein